VEVTVLVVDDEPVAREGLRRMLSDYDWVRVVGESENGPDAVAAINELHPDLVFLDVEMPGLKGTEVFGRVVHQPHVVFTTAFSEHAVTAFEIGALDYLLKPFGPNRFKGAMERVRAALGEPMPPPALERIDSVLRAGPISRLFVRAGSSIVPIAADRVAHFEANGDYVAAHMVDGSKHMIHVPLKRLAARLDPARFVRIHRSHVVNLDAVTAFRRAGRGRMWAVLDGGSRLPVSRSRAKEIRGRGL